MFSDFHSKDPWNPARSISQLGLTKGFYYIMFVDGDISQPNWVVSFFNAYCLTMGIYRTASAYGTFSDT